MARVYKRLSSMRGAFGDDSEASKTDINEYLADLKSYENRHFDYDDTKEVYDLLCSWLDNALKNGSYSPLWLT